MPNGSIDPWHALGILNTTVPGITPLFMVGTAHWSAPRTPAPSLTSRSAEMRPPSPTDLPDLTAARAEIAKLVKGWLS